MATSGEDASAERSACVSAIRKLGTAFEQAGVPMLYVGLDGCVVAANPQAEGMLGAAAGALVGRDWLELAHSEEDRATLRAECAELASPGCARRAFDVRLRTEVGAPIDARFVLSLVLDASKSPEGVLVVVETRPAKAAKLLRSEFEAAHLAAIVESADDAILSKDLDGVILSWNQGAERIFGYTADEIIGRSILTLIPEERHEEEPKILEQIRRGERIDHYETVRRTKDRRDLFVSITISPIHDTDGRVVGASKIVRDITEKRAAEEHLRQSAKMEAIGRLAGGIAHDFNNQIQALRGFADLVAMDAGIGPRALEDLSDVRRAAERMGLLTRQLLAFSRQQVLELERVDLNAAVRETQPMLQRLIGSPVCLRLELGAGAAWVEADRSQLDQVLLNLVINARDALPRGGDVTLCTAIRDLHPDDEDTPHHPELTSGTVVELRVSDTGTGIAPEVVPHIFEPFFTTKDVGKGTGLGLATVHGIVAQSHGAIWAESTPGEGTTMVLLFPLVGEAAGDAAVTGGPTPPRRRILVVEDEEFVRRFIVRALQLADHEVLEARHGREALELLERLRGAVELVVTDVVMPVMGGEELGQAVARTYPGLPVLYMSGYAPEAAFRGDAPEHFLNKPVSADDLLRAVEELVWAGAERGA